MLDSTSTKQPSNSGQLAFLRRVSEDDRFRAELVSDPQAALAQFGLQVDPAQIPESVCIPQQAALQDLFDDLEGSETDAAPQEKWRGFFGS